MSARHEGGSIACSFFSSTHTTADKENTLLGKGLAATLGKRERGRVGEKENVLVEGRKIGGKEDGREGGWDREIE